MRKLSDLLEMGESLGIRRFIRFAHQSLRSCLRFGPINRSYGRDDIAFFIVSTPD